jgi:hypothetical protein
MNDYMVIATVGSKDYLTRIFSSSFYSAERKILDLSISGKHTCGVTSCIAYDDSTITSENFLFSAFHSQPVTFDELKKIIECRNDEIRKNDEKEGRIAELEIQIETLQAELKLLKE